MSYAKEFLQKYIGEDGHTLTIPLCMLNYYNLISDCEKTSERHALEWAQYEEQQRVRDEEEAARKQRDWELYESPEALERKRLEDEAYDAEQKAYHLKMARTWREIVEAFPYDEDDYNWVASLYERAGVKPK